MNMEMQRKKKDKNNINKKNMKTIKSNKIKNKIKNQMKRKKK